MEGFRGLGGSPKQCKNICLRNICYQKTLAPKVKPFKKLTFGGSILGGVPGGSGTLELCRNISLLSVC